MYRYLAILSVLILSLSACGSNESAQVPHDASLSKALTATSESTKQETAVTATCPVTNKECNLTPQECATLAAIDCQKVATPDCPMTAAQDCDKAATVDCPMTAAQSNEKVVTADCPMTATQESVEEATLTTKNDLGQEEAVISPVVEETVVTATAAAQSPAYTTSILTLNLENDFGAVLVPHSQHVEMYSCEVCHPTTPPGKIEKTKKEFHALCRKCHVDEQAGPTKCRDCHQR